MKKILPIAIIIAIVAFMAYKLTSNKKKLDATKNAPTEVNLAIPVNIAIANKNTLVNNLLKSGKLIPYKEANITALTAGKLVSLNFNLGTMISQGGTIAQVDSRTLELNLAAAQLASDKADKDYNRLKRLFEGEAATETSVLDAKLNLENTQNQLEQLRKQIADTRIKSPISGQVIEKNIENGEFVAAGTVLGKIVDLSRLKVRVMVSEKDVYTLKMNQNVKVTTDVYPTKVFDGKITFISGQGDATFNYEIEITLSNNKKEAPLKAGTFAYVDFNQTSNDEQLFIPRSAIVESLQNPYVYLVKNNHVEKKDVVVLKDFGNQVAISEGLNVGDTVVTSGHVNIRPGSNIKPITSAVANSENTNSNQ